MPEKQPLSAVLPDAAVGIHVFADRAKANLHANIHLGLDVLEPNGLAGKRVTICGCGPSLAEHLDQLDGWVIACNAALPWLLQRQITVHCAYGTDVNDGLWTDWADAPNVVYLAATSTQTTMLEHLIAKGRKVLLFHAFRGFDWEVPFYEEHYPPTIILGHGLNAVNRCLQLCLWLGADHVTVLGGDCAFKGPGTPSPAKNHQHKRWMRQQIAYMDGRSAWEVWGNQNAVQIFYRDRVFVTRFDMAASVKDLVLTARLWPERVTILGNPAYSMPVAMRDATDEELANLPEVSEGGKIGHIKPSLHAMQKVG